MTRWCKRQWNCDLFPEVTSLARCCHTAADTEALARLKRQQTIQGRLVMSAMETKAKTPAFLFSHARICWERFCKLAKLFLCLLRQQSGGRDLGAVPEVRCARQREACPLDGATAGLPHVGTHTTSNWNPKQRQRRGGFLEEAVHPAASAATFAEGAERNATVRQREHPAISARRGVAGAKEHFQFRGA